jgi:hypothetical protein
MATSEKSPSGPFNGCRLSKRRCYQQSGESWIRPQTRRLLLVIYLYPRIDTLIHMIYSICIDIYIYPRMVGSLKTLEATLKNESSHV